jgi:hypothetical protein
MIEQSLEEFLIESMEMYPDAPAALWRAVAETDRRRQSAGQQPYEAPQSVHIDTQASVLPKKTSISVLKRAWGSLLTLVGTR